MDREALFAFVKDAYGTKPEYLFSSSPETAVLRHTRNRKWYAITMPIPAKRLGLESDDIIDVLNLKCNPDDGAALRMTEGVFPAYHMNKKHWISVVYSMVPEGLLLSLLETSYQLTSPKKS